MLLFVAQVVITGGLAGTTVTVNSQPAPVELVQVTTVDPTGNTDPEAGEQLTVPQSPLVVGAEYVTAAAHWFGEAVCVTSEGQVTTQLPSPTTVTVKLQEAEFCAESVVVQVTVVMPLLNLVPDGGSQMVVTQLPVVVGE
jgi:hypothetical protein